MIFIRRNSHTKQSRISRSRHRHGRLLVGRRTNFNTVVCRISFDADCARRTETSSTEAIFQDFSLTEFLEEQKTCFLFLSLIIQSYPEMLLLANQHHNKCREGCLSQNGHKYSGILSSSNLLETSFTDPSC